jgi:putative two-component system response regulator
METLMEMEPAIILVADDEDLNRRMLSEILKMEGYRVRVASDGDEALRMLRSERIDLALLDVAMPGRSGFEVCQTVKSLPEMRLLPIVMVTGLGQKEDRIKGIECGADDFLTKPIHRGELSARISACLRVKRFTDELENAETVLYSLARGIEAKDAYTEGHCDRLSKYSVALAIELGLPPELQVALRRAGVVHDIGKIGVPEHILQKPGPLTPEERKVIEEHPVVGERICQPLKSFRHVLPIIRHHHERMDGTGYPDGLRGEAIPFTARIMTTVDVYDALSTDRPYRKALPPEEAFQIMREEVRKGWWEERLVEQFAALMAKRGANSLAAMP